ncbi:sensor histidine kinase [Gordonibacter urolithinfaciens]|uniref:sensor histidine kinase n=1 Tax=Gordonibacter urolithinfaciens TaxID=1335613 RepID=UPI003AAB4666
MNSDDSFRIRPAGRHLLTIGEDLIKDKPAALVELVKNAYDADSPDIHIIFTGREESTSLAIEIIDHGHGMTRDDVVGKWLVPSTDSKMKNKKSPAGRTMQGKKGIGRYAAGVLGDSLLLETTDESGSKTSVLLNWEDFRVADYLDSVPVTVHTEQTTEHSGTTLLIEGGPQEYDYWSEQKLGDMIADLRKLIPPDHSEVNENSFEIFVHYRDYPRGFKGETIEKIEPYPILEAFDYQIEGIVNADGTQNLTYRSQKRGQESEEPIENPVSINGSSGCGSVRFDIRVFDRELEALDETLKRGPLGTLGESLSRQDVRVLLNQLCGIGVYRSGFRIRPLGDPENDWLRLNARRVQNPSMRIGVNQVVGYIHVESEDLSGLEEKSARDGLKENAHYDALKELALRTIQQLEERRFRARRKMSKDPSAPTVGANLDGLKDYSDLRKSIADVLADQSVPSSSAKLVDKIIKKEEERKSAYAKRVADIVDAYRGQATLGKVMEIVLHEGRRPLNYFKNQVPNLLHYLSKVENDALLTGKDKETIERILRGLTENADMFADLFSRIEPLSTRKRSAASPIKLANEISKAIDVFEPELKKRDIKVELLVDDSLEIVGWGIDVYTIFVNLLDNSIYWLGGGEKRNIRIESDSRDGVIIDYYDSGPGIADKLLEDMVVFEPGYSAKGGTGLGLAIAGEAAAKIGFKLEALSNKKGAHFRLGQLS